MSGPHDTSVPRLRQIAEDLSAEGWHTIAGTIAQVADEIEERNARDRRCDAALSEALNSGDGSYHP